MKNTTHSFTSFTVILLLTASGAVLAAERGPIPKFASALRYVCNSFGNRAGFVTPQDVAKARAATKDRTQPWTIAGLRAALHEPLANRKDWMITASHKIHLPRFVAPAALKRYTPVPLTLIS